MRGKTGNWTNEEMQIVIQARSGENKVTFKVLEQILGRPEKNIRHFAQRIGLAEPNKAKANKIYVVRDDRLKAAQASCDHVRDLAAVYGWDRVGIYRASNLDDEVAARAIMNAKDLARATETGTGASSIAFL